MAQQEVFDFLKTNREQWFTSKELADVLNLSMGSVTSNLKKLRKTNSIHYEIEKRDGHRNYLYTYKISRMDRLRRNMKNMLSMAGIVP